MDWSKRNTSTRSASTITEKKSQARLRCSGWMGGGETASCCGAMQLRSNKVADLEVGHLRCELFESICWLKHILLSK